MTNHVKLTPVKPSIPPLESGSSLSRTEFERRYEAMSEHTKAELIEGIVYIASPVRFEHHAEPHGQLIVWMGMYQLSTPGVKLGIEPTIRLDEDNEPQPDRVLLIDPLAGGSAEITEDDYLQGAPEFVAEIAASSAAYDLHDKKRAYRRNGVAEYLVWQQFENRLYWFVLTDSEYVALEPDADGTIRSRIMPGLWLATDALLQGNMQQVLAVLQAGLNSDEHQAFVHQLAQRLA